MSVEFARAQTIANAVITKIGAGGDVCVFNSQTTHIIVDVAGEFP